MGAAWKIVQGCLYTAIVSMLSIAMLPGITCARHIEFLMNEPASTTQMSTTNRASLKYDCLSDNECPIGKYCNFHDGDLLEFGECVPLVKKDGKCTSSYDRHVWIWFDESSGPYEHHNCAKGLYCNRSQKCRRAADIGGNCDAAIYHSCKQGTYCDGKKCKKQGVKGESCNPSSYPHKPCDQSRGLFCKHTEEDAKKGTCEHKLEAGKESQRTGCQGFEIRPVGHENLVCMSGRSEGQLCTKNSQCRGKKRDGSTRMETVCNWIDKKMGRLPRYGVCAKETSLLKKVGLACQTKKDLCDARRDLRCEKRGGKNVCVQNGGFNAYGKSHCTPGSKYSTCPGQTCRQLTKMISQSSYGPFLCLHSVEVLKEGEICSLFEHTHCGKGLKCVKALEVSTMGGSSEPLAYCVRHVMQGKKCNKRRCMPDPCKAGSVCVNGECSSGEMMDNMARCPGHGVSCKMQNPRCAPGLICSGGACLLPTKTVDVGEACGETSPANKVRVTVHTKCIPSIFVSLTDPFPTCRCARKVPFATTGTGTAAEYARNMTKTIESQGLRAGTTGNRAARACSAATGSTLGFCRQVRRCATKRKRASRSDRNATRTKKVMTTEAGARTLGGRFQRATSRIRGGVR